MRRLLAAVPAALLCLFLSVPATAGAGEHPWLDKRIHYLVEQGGMLVEKGFFILRRGSFRKQECRVVEDERAIYDPASPAAPQRIVRSRTTMTPDGLALHRVESPVAPETAQWMGQETITVSGETALFDASGAYGAPGRVPVPGDLLFDISGEFLASLPRRRDAAFTAHLLDRATRSVVAAEIFLSGEERQEPGSDTPVVLLADIAAPGRENVTAWYTPDGRLMRLEGGGMKYQVVSRADYELGAIPLRGIQEETPREDAAAWDAARDAGTGAPAEAAARISIGASVPAWDSFAWLRLDATPPFEWNSALSSSEYAQTYLAGPALALTALRNAPVVDATIAFPMDIPPDIRPFLLSSELIPSDHRAVVEAAYAAVADGETNREERNVLRAVSFLAGWIHQSVAVEEWKGYDSGALATLAARSGDSLGHARLFSAMARTLGAPTRVCQGFLARGDGAVNHCWAEVWIGGRWIPVDTTVSRVGLPAGYVLAERGQGNGEFRFDFAGFMRSGELGLRLVAAGRETPSGGRAELIVGDRSTYAFSEEDWLTNLYWGFSLRLPDGWRGRARLNSVELTSQDRLASARCEALEGDFTAGEGELRETVESLRSSLSRFRMVENRVVAFDEDGATPAMFIDFTCVEEGKTLRCRQYVVPRRGRAFRLSFWAPSGDFLEYLGEFDSILASVEF